MSLLPRIDPERKPPVIQSGNTILCQSCEMRAASVTVQLDLRLALDDPTGVLFHRLKWFICQDCAMGAINSHVPTEPPIEVHIHCAGTGHGRVLK